MIIKSIGALAFMAAPALASEAPQAIEATSPSGEEQKVSPFQKAEPIAEVRLAEIAGREDVNQINNAEQTNAVSDNAVGDNSVTGELSVSDQAFSNTNGFVILNANTGNNVAINASIQVNVALPQTAGTGQ